MIATVERLGVDAAIIFSDLLPLLEPMGLDLEFTAGEGPVIHNPVRAAADVERVRELDDVDRVGFVMDTVAATRAGLDDSIPVIGFAGAPFTLAGYCIEGGTSKAWTLTKTFMMRHETAWHDLLGTDRPGGEPLSRRPARRRRAARAALRQLGRLPRPRRLPPLRAAPLPGGDGRGGQAGTGDPLRHRQPRPAAALGRGGRERDRDRLADRSRPRLGGGRARPGRPGQPRPRRAA